MTNLRLFKVVAGLPLHDFAKQCHLSPSRISLIERRGFEEASQYEVRRISQAVGIHSEQIVKRLLQRVDPERFREMLLNEP